MSNFEGFGVLEISGQVEPVISSSLDSSGSLNVRRDFQRRQYTRLVIGEDSIDPPSWTQLGISEAHGFVIPDLSSSDHEISRLNAFSSGNFALEESDVPASASVYYAKANRFVRKVYKLSASVDLPVIPPDIEQFPHLAEHGSRPLWVASSGSYRNYTYWDPAVFEIDVPDHGKIRDIKVWVELVHDIRSGTGSLAGYTGSDGTHPNRAFTQQGLQSLQISLKSPNVDFRAAHPLWNDPEVVKGDTLRPFHVDASGFAFLTGSNNQFKHLYNDVPKLLRSSYLLWQGHAHDIDDIITTADFHWDDVPHYAEYDSDIDMRTIFTDDSNIPNPRHIDRLYENPTDQGPGVSTGTEVGSSLSTLRALGDPEAFASGNLKGSTGISGPFVNLRILGDKNKTSYVPNSGTNIPGIKGNNTPWFYDPRLKPGFINAFGFTAPPGTGSLGMSPPDGWLTGPNDTAGIGEFDTTGSQIGPAHMKPVYPLLDDVFVEKFYFDTKLVDDALDVPLAKLRPDILKSRHYSGFRPGLRGTEIHGKWKLLIGTMMSLDMNGATAMNEHEEQRCGTPIFDPLGLSKGFIAHPRAGFWFRQFRLEFLVDQGEEVRSFYPSNERRFRKPGYVSRPDKSRRRIHLISGSANFDLGVNYVFTGPVEEYGRTVGITANRSSSLDSFAIFTHLTGALADRIGTDVPFIFLNNEFGVPFLPISLGSGIDMDPQLQSSDEDARISREFKDSVLFPTNPFVSDQTIKAALNKSDYFKTTTEKATDKLTELLASGSAG